MMDIDWRYINLDHRTDRREHIEAELRKVGIEATRFAALTKEDYTGPPANVAKMQHTPNTIGNWLSHTALMRLAEDYAAADYDAIVGVLEDDALLCSDFQWRLQYISDTCGRDWDIFFLGGTFHDDRGQWHPEIGRDHELTDVPHIVRMYGAWSNQGYLINGERAGKVLDMMQAVMPHSTGSDHALIQIQPSLDCYAFVPGCVFQIDGPSDIGNGITRFSNFLKMGKYVWTDTLAEFDWAEWEQNQRSKT